MYHSESKIHCRSWKQAKAPESLGGDCSQTRPRLQWLHSEPHTGNRLRCPLPRSVPPQRNGRNPCCSWLRARQWQHRHHRGNTPPCWPYSPPPLSIPQTWSQAKRSAGLPQQPLSALKIGCACRSVPRKIDFLPDTSGAGFFLPVGRATQEPSGAAHKRLQESADKPRSNTASLHWSECAAPFPAELRPPP